VHLVGSAAPSVPQVGFVVGLSRLLLDVAILKKRLALDASLHEILQVLSVTLFEQVPILQAFGDIGPREKSLGICSQLKLWNS